MPYSEILKNNYLRKYIFILKKSLFLKALLSILSYYFSLQARDAPAASSFIPGLSLVARKARLSRRSAEAALPLPRGTRTCTQGHTCMSTQGHTPVCPHRDTPVCAHRDTHLYVHPGTHLFVHTGAAISGADSPQHMAEKPQAPLSRMCLLMGAGKCSPHLWGVQREE